MSNAILQWIFKLAVPYNQVHTGSTESKKAITAMNTFTIFSCKKFPWTFSVIFTIVLTIGSSNSSLAQDIHFSQFYHAPMVLNPALTGISKSDVRFSGIYRNQWQRANAPFETAYVSAENRFYRVTHPNWWFSGGMHVFYDKAGASHLTNTQLAISGSFTRMLDPENFLTLGVQAGFGQRAFDYGLLTFDAQWNGDVFDPARPTNENFDNTNFLYPDFSAGINWRGQKENTRSKIDVGIGFHHFNTPKQTFYKNDKQQLPMRLSVYFNPNVQVSENFDLIGFGTIQLQGKYLEALAGFGGRYFLSTKRSRELALQVGVEYRFNSIGDAIIPVTELQFRYLTVGLSWDVNISGFSVASNRNGGPEIAVRYYLFRVYPLKAFACPLI